MSDSARSTLLATTTGALGGAPLRTNLVEALLSQFEHVRPLAVERDALPDGVNATRRRPRFRIPRGTGASSTSPTVRHGAGSR